jgi:hypothetical protein
MEGDEWSTAGGTRTPNLRFWRPQLYQLSYCRMNYKEKAGAGRFSDPPQTNNNFL